MSRAEAVSAILDEARTGPPVLRMVWPTLRPEARHGLAGEIVAAIEPHSEADPAALLGAFLAEFGALVGRGPHAQAEGAEHPARIWVLVVGDTSKARKGSSQSQVRRVVSAADPRFMTERVLGGFGSGESLVDAVAGENVDRRLLVVEEEYGRVLAVSKREGSTLPSLLREAWDGNRLQVRSRAGTAVADGAHIVVVGQITGDELLSRVAEADVLGGSLNRFLIIAARRSKLLPSGGNLDEGVLTDLGRKIASVAQEARTLGLVRRSREAEDYWARVYERLAGDDPGGLLGAVLARDAAQLLRLSVTYALLDRSQTIGVDHVRAAEAVWDYARASAAMLIGGTGDFLADRILRELQRRGRDGLDRTGIRDLLGRHATKERIDRAMSVLLDKGLATEATKSTRGRPRTVYSPTTEATKATKLPAADDRDFWSTAAADDYMAKFEEGDGDSQYA